MQPDAAALLWDARRAAELIDQFVADPTWEDYRVSPMISSAVERQFEIVGEELNKLDRTDPMTAEKIPDLARIIAFRNVLIHGYATIDDRIVWDAATERLPELLEALSDLLDEASEQDANRAQMGSCDE